MDSMGKPKYHAWKNQKQWLFYAINTCPPFRSRTERRRPVEFPTARSLLHPTAFFAVTKCNPVCYEGLFLSGHILMTKIVLHVECGSFPVSQHLPNHRQTIWGWPICLKPLADLPVQAMCRFLVALPQGRWSWNQQKGHWRPCIIPRVIPNQIWSFICSKDAWIAYHNCPIIQFVFASDGQESQKIPNQFQKEFNIYCKYSTWKACAKDHIKWSDFSFYSCPSGLVVWRPHWQSFQACNKPWEW